MIDAFVGEAAAEGSRLRVRGVLVRFQMDWEGWEERTGGDGGKKVDLGMELLEAAAACEGEGVGGGGEVE